MKRILFVIVFILLCPAASWAAGYCGVWGKTDGGSTPWTVSSDIGGTASVEYADVNACANTYAAYGDTINIPAGTAKWASTLILTKDVIIKGAGYGSTVIQADYNAATNSNCYAAGIYASGACFIKFDPDSTAVANIDELGDSGQFEVSDITLEILNYTSGYASIGIYIVESTPIRRVMVHGVKFINVYNALHLNGNIYGVVYDSIFEGLSYLRVRSNNYTAWESSSYSPGSSDALYVEDCTIAGTGSGNGDFFVYAEQGAKYVVRYNTFSAWTFVQMFDAHGNQKETAGTQGYEIYGNRIQNLSGSGNDINGRGGQGKVFYNYRESGTRSLNAVIYEEYPNGAVTNVLRPEAVGSNYLDDTTSTPSASWDDGNYSVVVVTASGGDSYIRKITDVTGNRITVESAWDPLITTSTYYYVVNDVTRSTYPDMTVLDNYFWSNRNGENPIGVSISTLSYWINGLVEDVNFFVEESGFDGTSGVGCGAIGDRPLTCTTGTAYWATDQGNCSDLTGYVGANATKIEGKLYKCTATDTWTEYYTPYTYPHPLRTEETPPSLTVTVTNTGSGHSPSHDGARTVQTGGSLTFTSGVYNGWKVAIAGTCGCTTDGCTVTPTENCTITCTSTAIQLMPW